MLAAFSHSERIQGETWLPGCLAGWLLSNVPVSLPNLNISARPLPPAFSSAPKFGYAYGGRLGGLPASSSGRWYPSPHLLLFFFALFTSLVFYRVFRYAVRNSKLQTLVLYAFSTFIVAVLVRLF